MFPLRLVTCELEGFGVLAPSRLLSFQPGFNLIVGDAGAGKSTLVAALVGAFRGLKPEQEKGFASGSTPLKARLQVQGPADLMELRADWSTHSVELSVPEEAPLYQSNSWSELLGALEKHTGLTGLAATCFLSATGFGFTLPPGVEETLQQVPQEVQSTELQERTRMLEQREELLHTQVLIHTHQKWLTVLKERLEPQLARFQSAPEGFHDLLTSLIQARLDVRRLTAEEASHAEAAVAVKAELEAARGELETRYQGLTSVPSDYPALLHRYKQLEAELEARRGELDILHLKLAELRRQVQAFELPGGPLPEKLEAVVLSLFQDAAETDFEPSDPGLEFAAQAAMDALCEDVPMAGAPHFVDQLAELEAARREVSDLKEKIQALGAEFHTFALQGILHQQAAQWPDDFADQLGQLRHQQNVLKPLARDIEQQQKRRQPVEAERAAVAQALEAFQGLEQQEEGVAARVEELVRRRHHNEDEVTAEASRRLAQLEESLANQYDWLAPLADHYPDLLLEVCRLSFRVGLERQAMEQTLASIARLATAKAALQSRLSGDLADLAGLPPDFPQKVQEHSRLTRLQKTLEARRDGLLQQISEQQAQLDRDFAEFAQLDSGMADRLQQLRGRDALLYRTLLRLDADVEARQRTESELSDVTARLDWLPALPDGLPTLLEVVADSDRWLQDLDSQIQALAGDSAPSAEDRSELEAGYAHWCEQRAGTREADQAVRQLSEARAKLNALKQALEQADLPLNDSDVNAWYARQEEIQTLLNALNQEAGLPAKGRKTRKMSWLGAAEPVESAEVDELKNQLIAAETARTQQLARWKVSTPELVPALLMRDREARERLAVARMQVEWCEAAALAHPMPSAGPGAPPEADAHRGEDALRKLQDLRRADEARLRRDILEAQRTKLAAAVQTLRDKIPALPPDAEHMTVQEAYEREVHLRESKTSLQAQLDLLRSGEELESDRRELIAWVSKGLADLSDAALSDERVRRLIEYQQVMHELESLQAATEGLGSGSKVGLLIERLLKQRAQLEAEVGPILAEDPTKVIARHKEYLQVAQEAADLDTQASALPSEETLQHQLSTRQAELQQAMERLRVSDANSLGPALQIYAAYRSMVADRDHLKASVQAAREQAQSRMAELEQSVGRWAQAPVDAEALAGRWREAIQSRADLAKLDAQLATMPTVEAMEAEYQSQVAVLEAGCILLGVPVDSSQDLELIHQWSEYTAWRQQMNAMSAELDAALQPSDHGSRLDHVMRRSSELEERLGLEPTDDIEDIRQRCVSTEPLRASAEALLARQVLACERDSNAAEALATAGLPTPAPGTALASLQQYLSYGRVLQDVRSTTQALEEAQRGSDGPEAQDNLQQAINEIRPQLGGRESHDADAEAKLYAEFTTAAARSKELEVSFTALEADHQTRDDRMRAEDVELESETRLGEWLSGVEPDRLLAEYDTFAAARKEIEELTDVVAKLPSLQNIAVSLEAADRALALLEPSSAAEPSVEQVSDIPLLQRCQARAAEIMARVTAGRYVLRLEGDDIDIVTNTGERAPQTDALLSQVELWWRLAVCLELRDKHPWPIVLDEPFAGLSTGDSYELAEFLLEMTAESQVIVLTANRGLALDVTDDLNVAVT